MLGHADVALQIVCGNVDKNTRLVLDSYYLTRMFHKPCCWSKTTGLVDVRRPG